MRPRNCLLVTVWAGAAVLAAAPQIPEVRAIATIGSPSDPSHVKNLFSEDLEAIATSGEATVDLAGRHFRITKQFLQDISQAELASILPKLRRALLVMHSPIDNVVSVDHAKELSIRPNILKASSRSMTPITC